MRKSCKKLAQLIKIAAKDVSMESSWWKTERVSVMLGFERTDSEPDLLVVRDDSGYRAIIVGDTRGNVSLDTGKRDNMLIHHGYAYLYSDNASYEGDKRVWESGYRCFPPVKEIAEKLEMLYKGVECPGIKYFDGDSEDRSKTIFYLASVVKKYADCIGADRRSPQEIFNACQ